MKIAKKTLFSILCVASKLLEFHVHKCLYRYICDKDILCSNQSGFRRNHSCLTCLTNMVESWYFAINEGNIVGSVELDFSKAFDILDHEILLNKLKFYGCDSRSLSWFISYLSGRSQIVKTDDVISSSANIGYGIAQGSILGPLLFILYTNDLHLFIKNSRLDSYADDSNISFVSKSIKMVITNLQDDLNSITNWCNVNKMVLNVKKCNFMILCTPAKSRTFDQSNLNLTIDGKLLNTVHTQSILGVTTDSSLSWRVQINNISKSVSQLVGLLWGVRYFLDNNGKKLFFNALILPKLTYCISLWGKGPKDAMLCLYRLQKRALRIILGCGIEVSSKELFTKYERMTIFDLYTYHVCVFMYKIKNDLCPGYLSSLFTMEQSNFIYNIRSYNEKNVKIPFPRIEHYKKSLLFSGSTLWNSLPNNLKNTDSLYDFKSMLKKYILSKQTFDN